MRIFRKMIITIVSFIYTPPLHLILVLEDYIEIHVFTFDKSCVLDC